MKKLLSITLTTLLVLFASQAFGQTNTSEDVTINAEVVGQLSITTQQDLDFGTIPVNSSPSINANEDSDAVLLTIEGDNGDIGVSYDTSVSLEEGGNSITFTPSVVGDADDGNQSSASNVGNETNVTIADGNFYLWLGGDLSDVNEQGTYEGTIGFEVTYNTY